MSLLDDVSIVVTPNGYKAGTLYGVLPTATLGSELLSQSVDLTTDFVANAGGVIVDLDTFTSAGGTFDGLVSSTNTFEIGKRYKLIISGNTTSSGFGFYPASGSGFYGDGFGTHYFTATHEKLWVRQQTSGTTNITSFSIKEFTASDMDVTRATAATRVDENGLLNYAEVLGSELVVNGDVESALPTFNGVSFSNYQSANTQSSLQSHLGTNSMKVTGTGTLFNTRIIPNNSSYLNKTFKVSLWVYNPSTLTGDIAIRTRINAVAKLIGTLSVKNTWTNFTYYTTSTNTSSDRFIEVEALTGTNTQFFFIDDISVKEADLNNVPRIDYTGGGCPHILAEPQRTNQILNSNDISLLNNVTAGDGVVSKTANYALSPDGTQNATRVVASSTGSNYALISSTAVSSTSGDYVGSVYLKSNNGSNQNVALYGRSIVSYVTITPNWERYSVVASGSSSFLNLGSRTSYGSDSSLDFLAWGIQIEHGSYATSLIPTSGSSVTRNADQFSRDGISSLINSTEGVLFAEIASLSNDGTYREISLNDGATNNVVEMRYTPTDNQFQFVVRNAANIEVNNSFIFTNALDFNKIAFSYKTDDYKIYINGVQVATDTSGTMPSGLNTLSLDWGGINNFYGKVKQLQVYDTALTDMQLIQLTGTAGTDFYESYSEMAESLTYTIQ